MRKGSYLVGPSLGAKRYLTSSYLMFGVIIIIKITIITITIIMVTIITIITTIHLEEKVW